MFGVGFSINIDTIADDGSTLAYLAQLADDTGALVQGGRPLRNCDCTHGTNVMSVLDPTQGEPQLLAEYAKIHPFTAGRELEAFTGGHEVTTYPWGPRGERDPKPLTVAPAICYDLRFPELFRVQMLRGAECFALGACWPHTRQHHWRALAIARAIENQAFMLACNRTGTDPHLKYIGGSIAVDPQGNVLGELGDEEAVLTVEIDPAAVRGWREQFAFYQDARLITADAAVRPG